MSQPLQQNQLHERQAALEGMEGIRCFWDARHNHYTARIMPGEFYVTKNQEIITTVLGSCVSACIRDPELAIGGMNHFMLPDEGVSSSNCPLSLMQYGVNAMEILINTILANGGDRNRLEVKLFGGASVLKSRTNVGTSNIKFVHEFLREEGMDVASEHLGGLHPRKIIYFPFSGRTLMKKLPINNPEAVGEREYLSTAIAKIAPGEIELF